MASRRLKKKRSKEWNACALCGRPTSPDSGRVVGKTGRCACKECLSVSARILELPRTSRIQDTCRSIITPAQMVKELDKSIIGQEQAKRAVSVALWKQQLRAQGVALPNSGLLLYGPTGCGKTALVREASRIADLPFLACDATSLTETGYKGRNALDMIPDLVERWGPEKAAHSVIFLDEVDKLAATAGNEYRASYNRGTQHSLLKMVEGCEVKTDSGSFDTSGILFLYGGAFTALREELKCDTHKPLIGFQRESQTEAEHRELLPEDFISYGMEPELMGRIGRCVPLRALTAEDLRRILLESELSAYRSYQTFFHSFGTSLELPMDTLDEVIHKAVERGMGARGLNALVEEWVEPHLFRIAEGA